MSYKQITSPNLDDSKLTVKVGGKVLSNWLGWCLAVTDATFGVQAFAETAYKAWTVNKTQHTNYDLPEGVYVPIFWSGGLAHGVTNVGHIAVARRTGSKVKIWSSPYSSKPYFDIFEGELKATANKITKTYGMSEFLGWTETLGSKTIIKEEIFELNYAAHVQRKGWLKDVHSGVAGLTGEGLRLEAFKISTGMTGNIEYRAHVQGIGWQDWKKNGEVAGTLGESKRVEAIQVKLSGEVANEYDVYYHTHIQNYGWLNWVKNGESSGSEGQGLRMEAFEIRFMRKGDNRLEKGLIK